MDMKKKRGHDAVAAATWRSGERILVSGEDVFSYSSSCHARDPEIDLLLVRR